MRGITATLVNFVSRRQPLAVAYLHDYLEIISLNSIEMEERVDLVYYQVLIHLVI